MKLRQILALATASSALFLLAACGGSSNSGPPPISVAFTVGFLPPANMSVSSQAGIAATVSNDSANGGVNWTVSCGSAGQCGGFQPTSTASTIPTTYTAPPAIPSGSTVTIKATSATDSTKSASATITITQGGAISVTFNPPPRVSMNINATAPFTAVVANDSANAGVTWTVNCGPGAPPCGFFNPTSTGSGVATSFQAPGSVPAGGTVTVTATSVTDNTKSASAVVAITSAPTTLADGTYVFNLAGEDIVLSNYYVAGAFTVSGGVITSGEQDFVDFDEVLSDVINGPTSSIQSTADGNLQIILDTQDPAIGENGLETINATLVSSARALINEFDTSASGTGTLTLQTSTAALADGYAFMVSGMDINALPMAIGGVINVDGGTVISGNGSVFDFNDAPTEGVFTNQAFDPSTVTTPDAFGRVQFNLFPSNLNTFDDITLIGYIVDGNTIQLVEGTDDLVGTTGGVALAQGGNTGNFANASLSGLTFVVGAQGGDTSTYGFDSLAGTLTFNANLSIAGNLTFNDIDNQLTGNINGGSYAVDATGRVTISNLQTPTLGPATVQAYLDGNGNAVTATMDLSDVTAGPAFQQTANSAFSGDYALSASGVAAAGQAADFWGAVGPINTSAVDGSITGFTDFNLFDSNSDIGVPVPNVALFGTSAGSNDILNGTITGLDAFSGDVQHTFTYYLIDDSRSFAIEFDNTQTGVTYAEGLTGCSFCGRAKHKAKR